MLRAKMVNNGVFYADEKPVIVGHPEIDFLKNRVDDTDLKRIRLCAHTSTEDELHEMLIVLSKNTYIRPAKHLNKSESMLVIKGEADAIFFDEQGEIINIIELGDYSTGKRFYYRMDDPIYHTLILKSDYFIIHESTQGPFNPDDTVAAPWSPDESNTAAARSYANRLAIRVVNEGLTH